MRHLLNFQLPSQGSAALPERKPNSVRNIQALWRLRDLALGDVFCCKNFRPPARMISGSHELENQRQNETTRGAHGEIRTRYLKIAAGTEFCPGGGKLNSFRDFQVPTLIAADLAGAPFVVSRFLRFSTAIPAPMTQSTPVASLTA